MSIDISMVYTENPYIDILIYNTKLLGINTVLKLQDQADKYETAESLKHADMLLMCKEGTIIFDLFDEFSEDVLRASGLIGLPLISAMNDPSTIPVEMRDTVVKKASEEFIKNYEDKNTYYRMLSGLPPEGHEDYVTDWTPPSDIIIDLSIPVHKMPTDSINILNNYGVLDDMYKEDKDNRAYMKYLDRKIDPYAARKAGMFGVLYIPSIDSSEIEKEYRDRLDVNREYALRSLYQYAYKFDSEYYDNMIAVFIVLNAMIDVISRVQEFIARKEVFDLRTCQYIFESYGVDFFPTIPLRYQIRMIKNLHTLLKYKSTSKCMVDICSLFGFENIQIFKYYMMKNRKFDRTTGEYSFTGDDETDFDLKFVKIPIDEPMANYIRDPQYQLDYDEVVASDPTWNGGLEHEEVKAQHLSTNFNYIRTKYLSIESIYDIAKISAQQSYFFNMLYDNYELEEMLKINIASISTERGFKLADVFTFLTCLTHYFYGNKDLIMDTQGKVLYVNGFNFNADLAALSETLYNMRFDKEAQELLKKFNIPTQSILTPKQLIDIFVNNNNIRELLVTGMRNADSMRHYRPYKLLYDALMTVELNFDHFKNPETGDFYRDAEGDATYSAYLQNEDPILYYKLTELLMIEDDDNRTNQIINTIDNIVYIIEEWIDSEEFAGIFYSLPGVSIDAVKKYINEVIDFYKSYRVHILGINTIYYFDDPAEGYIHLIDDVLLNRWFEKDEIISIVDRAFKTTIKLSPDEKISLLDKVYLDISTWKNLTLKDRATVNDIYSQITIILGKDDSIDTSETLAFKTSFNPSTAIYLPDLINSSKISLTAKDNIYLDEHIYMKRMFNNYYIDSNRFYIYNVEIAPNGNTNIVDDRIKLGNTAAFTPYNDYVDMVDGTIVGICHDGYVNFASTCTEEISGVVEITSTTSF